MVGESPSLFLFLHHRLVSRFSSSRCKDPHAPTSDLHFSSPAGDENPDPTTRSVLFLSKSGDGEFFSLIPKLFRQDGICRYPDVHAEVEPAY
ncbi:hypothetical protein L1987_38197 [Smallanthus sonchifolius]|uniref:Uncharacterized protein n=1 Tax=Smallanthus sonchifolius TaxID=185202 RepID=A0ACB9HIU5_9ASTR|nr:hypothetical protein L1987_38197 [Smallanthus sonchifolius]